MAGLYRRDERRQPPADPVLRQWEDQLVRWLVREFASHPCRLPVAARASLLRKLREEREQADEAKRKPLERVLKEMESLFLFLLVPGSREHAEAVDHQEYRRERWAQGRRKRGRG